MKKNMKTGSFSNRLFARIFKRKVLRLLIQERRRCQHIVCIADTFIKDLEECHDLRQLLDIHKRMWREGIRNERIAPDRYGMFRTEDINTMREEEVYLGNIYGLWTFTIPEWEQKKGERYGANGWDIDPDTLVYDLVVRQYRELLLTIVRNIKKEAEEHLSRSRRS